MTVDNKQNAVEVETDEPAGMESLYLPIELHTSDTIVGHYSNHMVVQHDGQAFFISFYEVSPPVVVGDPEERERQVKELKSIRANCVARIIVPKGRMQSFVDTLKMNLESSQEVAAILEKKKKNKKKGTDT